MLFRTTLIVGLTLCVACSDSDPSPPPANTAATTTSAGGSSGTMGGGGAAGGTGGATSTGGNGAGGAGTGGFGGLVLSSTAFTDMSTLPDAYTCDGTDVSPPLSWSGAAPSTMSYAVSLVDSTADVVHWVIWDIPASMTSLPEDVDKDFNPADVPGAKQTLSYDDSTRGYLGPCSGGVNTYQYVVYAVGLENIPGFDMATTGTEAVNTLMGGSAGSAVLTVTH